MPIYGNCKLYLVNIQVVPVSRKCFAMFRIDIRFLILIFKTVATGHFCCVYQNRIDINRVKALVDPSY